ncbi:MAG TPA: UbiX family flavin prenyltransferase [Actinocrinis sp.]|nr:UbiX family flavin prenyltransferase [Actinocrinis sp.]
MTPAADPDPSHARTGKTGLSADPAPSPAPGPAPQRLVVGISGATGVAYGVRILELARAAGLETHLVVTPAGQQTRAYETDLSAADLAAKADVTYRPADIGAAIASGSFRTLGMIIAPCSIRTLSAIAYSVGDNLLTRAADVTLKERRRLVLLARETPLTLGHLRAMAAVTESGGIVMPPVPAFYLRPADLGELVTHTAARALDLLGVDVPGQPRWGEPAD